MNLFVGKQWRHRHREQTYGHSGEQEEGEGEMYAESNMEMDNIICKIRHPMGICYKTHKQGLCNNLEGWDEEGDERQFGR